MKLRFCLLFLAISLGIQMPLYANMGSPYFQGTMSAQAFASQKVKVLNENLYILIADDFQTAQITAQYEIETDSTGEGQFIPLLFLAERYQGDFQIWVDGQPVEWKPVPPAYIFDDFYLSFDSNKSVMIAWENNKLLSTHQFNDLKYFEAPLHKKRQTIKISYTAQMGKNRYSWQKSYTLSYAWSPARYWHSFGKLKLTIEKAGEPVDFVTNISQKPSQKTANIIAYELDKLPAADCLLLQYQAKIGSFTDFLIQIHPLGMMWIVFGFCLAYQLFYQYLHRKRLLPLVSTWRLWGQYAAVSAGIIVSPILTYACIYELIGTAANGRADYAAFSILSLFAFPFMWIIYGLSQLFLAQFLWLLSKKNSN